MDLYSSNLLQGSRRERDKHVGEGRHGKTEKRGNEKQESDIMIPFNLGNQEG